MNTMKILLILCLIISIVSCSSNDYKIISATAWVTAPIYYYPDFAASITPNDYRPSIFQYFVQGSSVVYTCTTRDCKQVSMTSMPGLSKAQFSHGGVPPRRVHQFSPRINNTQFFFSQGHATPNRNVELVVCDAEDFKCSQPRIMNTASSYGFGEGGLRLTFTESLGLPIVLIPEARYASADNRVTGYRVETCQDPLCQLQRSSVSLPFNLTGTANCEATSIDVAINQFGYTSWLTLCDEELNLIHCLTPTCNETLVNQFKVNRDFVYFVYLAVDSQFRFTITTTGQTAQSAITYIRCLDPNCTKNIEYQLSASNVTRFSGVRVQAVINPITDLPVIHLKAYPDSTRTPTFMFIICQDIECDLSKALYIDYGRRFGIDASQSAEMFVDDQGTIIVSLYTTYTSTNDTINAVVRMAQSSEPEIDKFTFVEPIIVE